jgi:FixJ family two-component response regulator
VTQATPCVFVVDDDASLRKAVGRLLKSVGLRPLTLASAEEFLLQPAPDGPACVVLDVSLPGLSGMDLQRALAQRHWSLPIVFISGHGDIPMSVRAMKAGAVDFLPKPFDDEDLLAAVRQALGRHARARQQERELAELRQRTALLSPRECEVMALVVSGKLNKQAGHQLGVAEKTIKAHRAQVMSKMRADSLADLVHMAQKLDSHPQHTS